MEPPTPRPLPQLLGSLRAAKVRVTFLSVMGVPGEIQEGERADVARKAFWGRMASQQNAAGRTRGGFAGPLGQGT